MKASKLPSQEIRLHDRQAANRRFAHGLRLFMCMAHRMRQFGQLIAVTFGVSTFAFAVERWLWYSQLPLHREARICGNCFLTTVGIPTEVALMGTLLMLIVAVRVRFTADDAFRWCCMVAGALLTPWIIGLPIFGFSLLVV